jgi:hypothetical protein
LASYIAAAIALTLAWVISGAVVVVVLSPVLIRNAVPVLIIAGLTI